MYGNMVRTIALLGVVFSFMVSNQSVSNAEVKTNFNSRKTADMDTKPNPMLSDSAIVAHNKKLVKQIEATQGSERFTEDVIKRGEFYFQLAAKILYAGSNESATVAFQLNDTACKKQNTLFSWFFQTTRTYIVTISGKIPTVSAELPLENRTLVALKQENGTCKVEVFDGELTPLFVPTSREIHLRITNSWTEKTEATFFNKLVGFAKSVSEILTGKSLGIFNTIAANDNIKKIDEAAKFIDDNFSGDNSVSYDLKVDLARQSIRIPLYEFKSKKLGKLPLIITLNTSATRSRFASRKLNKQDFKYQMVFDRPLFYKEGASVTMANMIGDPKHKEWQDLRSAQAADWNVKCDALNSWLTSTLGLSISDRAIVFYHALTKPGNNLAAVAPQLKLYFPQQLCPDEFINGALASFKLYDEVENIIKTGIDRGDREQAAERKRKLDILETLMRVMAGAWIDIDDARRDSRVQSLLDGYLVTKPILFDQSLIVTPTQPFIQDRKEMKSALGKLKLQYLNCLDVPQDNEISSAMALAKTGDGRLVVASFTFDFKTLDAPLGVYVKSFSVRQLNSSEEGDRLIVGNSLLGPLTSKNCAEKKGDFTAFLDTPLSQQQSFLSSEFTGELQ